MIVDGPHLAMASTTENDTKVSFRIVTDYNSQYDMMIARLDLLTEDFKQYNVGIEIIRSKSLPMPKGPEGFSTIISKKVLRQIFLDFADKLKD